MKILCICKTAPTMANKKEMYSLRPGWGPESFLFRAAVLEEDGGSVASRGMGRSNISSIGSVDSFVTSDRSTPQERGGLDFDSLEAMDEFRPLDSAASAPTPSIKRLTALNRLKRAVSTPVVTNDHQAVSTPAEQKSLRHDSDRKVEEKIDADDGLCSAGCFALSLREDRSSESPTKASSIPSPLNSLVSVSHHRNAGPYTIIAFVNSGSGGRKGDTILKSLRSHLGPSYVFDLKSCRAGHMPEDILLKYANDPKVRVLACGGDGTCGWIFSSLDKVWSTVLSQSSSKCRRVHLSKYKNHLPLAIMPLGTGNDLSRQFGWGGQFQSQMKDRSMITAVQASKSTYLDRFRCIIVPLKTLGKEETQLIPKILAENDEGDTETVVGAVDLLHSFLEEDDPKQISEPRRRSQKKLPIMSDPSTQIFDGVFCNYFSLGFDAEVVYLFHHEREVHPEKFTSPLKNKLVYVQKSPHALRSPKLRNRAKVLVANEKGQLEKLKIPKSCRGIILMNIQSYAGGRHLISKSKQNTTDGAIEVIFVSNVIRLASCAAMGPVMPFLLFEVAAQTNNVCIRTLCPQYCQVDGEPWLQEEGVIQIKFHSRNSILEKTKDDNSCGCIGGGTGESVITG